MQIAGLEHKKEKEFVLLQNGFVLKMKSGIKTCNIIKRILTLISLYLYQNLSVIYKWIILIKALLSLRHIKKSASNL